MTTSSGPLLEAPPIYRSRLLIGGTLNINCERPVPNSFRRFWYWALLGWHWEEV